MCNFYPMEENTRFQFSWLVGNGIVMGDQEDKRFGDLNGDFKLALTTNLQISVLWSVSFAVVSFAACE